MYKTNKVVIVKVRKKNIINNRKYGRIMKMCFIESTLKMFRNARNKPQSLSKFCNQDPSQMIVFL